MQSLNGSSASEFLQHALQHRNWIRFHPKTPIHRPHGLHPGLFSWVCSKAPSALFTVHADPCKSLVSNVFLSCRLLSQRGRPTVVHGVKTPQKNCCRPWSNPTTQKWLAPASFYELVSYLPLDSPLSVSVPLSPSLRQQKGCSLLEGIVFPFFCNASTTERHSFLDRHGGLLSVSIPATSHLPRGFLAAE